MSWCCKASELSIFNIGPIRIQLKVLCYCYDINVRCIALTKLFSMAIKPINFDAIKFDGIGMVIAVLLFMFHSSECAISPTNS